VNVDRRHRSRVTLAAYLFCLEGDPMSTTVVIKLDDELLALIDSVP
jgi:hypothetical protein